MSHFNKKTLTFYGTAIGSVLVLFSLVTRYGNNYLKAPVAIGGDYTLTITPSASCPNPAPLKLSIQQSGVYLTAALGATGPGNADTSQKPFTLNGSWRANQVDLTGRVLHLTVCVQGQGTAEGRHSTPVQIQGTLENKTLNGQISVEPSSERQNFTAQLEESAAVAPAGH